MKLPVYSSRFLGGVLLVAGTSIGAGMLALPVISAFGGLIPSLCALCSCWLFLFTTSLLLLDVNLAFRGEVNLVTMAEKTLGLKGKLICWIAYLLLLYSLTAAYIAAGTPPLLQALHLPSWAGPFPLLIFFGTFVYLGTQTVDWVNRFFIFGLVLSYALLASLIPPYIKTDLVLQSNFHAIGIAIPVMVTSFGFHIIIPTLTTYLQHDARKLRLTLLIGSLIPLFVYALWQFLILGSVSKEQLIMAWNLGQTSIPPLQSVIQNQGILTIASAFSFFAIITSFLGVTLSLSDFLTDGLHIKRFSWGREAACLLTFIPPLFFVLVYPKAFLSALQFAGIFVVILLCILPALMAGKLPQYRSPLKRAFLSFIILLSLFVIGLDIL